MSKNTESKYSQGLAKFTAGFAVVNGTLTSAYNAATTNATLLPLLKAGGVSALAATAGTAIGLVLGAAIGKSIEHVFVRIRGDEPDEYTGAALGSLGAVGGAILGLVGGHTIANEFNDNKVLNIEDNQGSAISYIDKSANPFDEYKNHGGEYILQAKATRP